MRRNPNPERSGDPGVAVGHRKQIVRVICSRIVACWHAFADGGAPPPPQPPAPHPGDRVLRLYIGGVVDIAIPDGLDEDGEGWDEWFADALEAALADGRWDDCTGIDDSVVGVLDERYRVR